MIIGITGGSGSGKTTLLNLIGELGGMVLDCDAIYHRLLLEDGELLGRIEARFPGVVEKGQLQRKKLGQIVFSDENALRDLNAITHAAVKGEVARLLEEKPQLAAIDAIGLVEGDLSCLCDVTVAVLAPESQRIERLMKRDGITSDYAKKRIAAQKSDEWFRLHCDHTLVNEGTQQEFRGKCIAFLRDLGIMKP